MNIETIIPLIISAFAVLISAYTYKDKVKRRASDISVSEATASKLITEAATSMLEPYQKRVEELECIQQDLLTQILLLKAENIKLRVALEDVTIGVKILATQLKEAQMTPEWRETLLVKQLVDNK